MTIKSHVIQGNGAMKLTHVGAELAVEVSCGRCQSRDTIGLTAHNTPAQAAAKKFMQRGWQFRNRYKKALCPTCNPKKTTRKKMPTPHTPRSAAPPPGSAKANRTMYSLLEDRFDPDARSYQDGWSDERVAKESGLSVQHVKTVREDAYGTTVDPEVAEARKQLDELLIMRARVEEAVLNKLAELDTGLTEMQRRLTKLETRRKV